MRIHYLQHVPFEDLGFIERWAIAHEIRFRRSALFLGEPFPQADEYDLLIIMGGPMGVHDEQRYSWLKPEKGFIYRSISDGKAVLGICLGAQLIAEVLGGKVYTNQYKEIGWYPVLKNNQIQSTSVGSILPSNFMAFHWHGDTFDIPSSAIPVGESQACQNQGFVYHEKVIAFQFHLESTQDSIEALLSNCWDELVPETFIQKVDIIRKNYSFISESNRLMDSVLDFLCK